MHIIWTRFGVTLHPPSSNPHPPSIWWIYHAINMGILFQFWERCPSIPITIIPPCHPFHVSLRAIVHIHLCISPLIHPFQVRLHQFMVTSVACVVGPSVNSTHFSFQTQFFWPFVWIFNNKNSLKNQYLPHLSSEINKINSINFDSPRAFQQHQDQPPKFQYSFQFQFYLIFIEKMVQ
jgi:hypothetical protein